MPGSHHAPSEHRAWGWLAVVAIIAELVCIAVEIGNRDWSHAVLTGTIALASLLAVFAPRRYLPPLFALLIALIGVIHGSGVLTGVLDDIYGADKVAHFLGGFALAAVAGCVWLRWTGQAPRRARLVLVFGGLALAIGMGWEVLEFLTIETKWPDTLGDLVFDTAGGALAAPFVLWALALSPARSGGGAR